MCRAASVPHVGMVVGLAGLPVIHAHAAHHDILHQIPPANLVAFFVAWFKFHHPIPFTYTPGHVRPSRLSDLPLENKKPQQQAAEGHDHQGRCVYQTALPNAFLPPPFVVYYPQAPLLYRSAEGHRLGDLNTQPVIHSITSYCTYTFRSCQSPTKPQASTSAHTGSRRQSGHTCAEPPTSLPPPTTEQDCGSGRCGFEPHQAPLRCSEASGFPASKQQSKGISCLL